MKRSLPFVLGALLVLAGIWAARAFLADAPRASGAASPALAARPERAAPRVTESTPDRDRDATREEEAPAESRAAVAASAPESGAAPARLVVDVRDALTREPLPGARLRYAELERGLVLEDHPGWTLESCDAWLAEHGREALAGPDGAAELAAPAGALLLVAGWAPQRFGRAALDLGQGSPQALLLQPDATLEVHTVHAGGAPVTGAEVALVRTSSSWGTWHQHRRTSDAHGRVVYAHVGALLEISREAWAVVAPSLLGRVERVALDPRALPGGPVRLVFPATGTVVVRVASAPGLPAIEDGGEVTLLVDEGRPDELLSFWSRPDAVARPIEDGAARFEHVPVGLDLIAESAPGALRVSSRARGRGPDAAGGTATLTLVVGGDHPIVRLRLLDPAGAPLASREVSARLDEDGHSVEFELSSDEQGRVLVDVRAYGDDDVVRTLTLTLPAADGEAGGRAGLTLPGDLTPGINDLGDLAFEAERALVAGRVVGPDGAPVGGAALQLASLVVYDGGAQTWIQELACEAVSEPDGSFVVHGADPGTRLRVSATAEGQRSAPVDCDVGTRDLRIELLRTGALAGRVRLDEGLDPTALRVTGKPAGEGEVDDYRRNEQAPVDADGRFQLGGLSPGPWNLEIAGASGGEPVANLERLEVPSGGPCTDARLFDIDLRGRLAQVQLAFRAPGPSDLVMGSLAYRPAGTPAGGEGEATLFLHSNALTLVVGARSADVDVLVNGFRPVELRGVRGEVEVELSRGPAVRLKLPEGAALPKPPRFLKPFLSASEEGSSMGGHFQQFVFDERREVLMHAPGPGRLRVHWFIEERSENSLSTMTLEVPEPQWIEVLDQSGEQVFELSVPDFGD